MAFLRVEIPRDVYTDLIKVAVHHWRPIQYEAEWLLREAIAAAALELPADVCTPEDIPREAARHSRKASHKVSKEALGVCPTFYTSGNSAS
jgi:hypothetical protein